MKYMDFETPLADELLELCDRLAVLERNPIPSVLELRAVRARLNGLATSGVAAVERHVQQLSIDIQNKVTLLPFDGTK